MQGIRHVSFAGYLFLSLISTSYNTVIRLFNGWRASFAFGAIACIAAWPSAQLPLNSTNDLIWRKTQLRNFQPWISQRFLGSLLLQSHRHAPEPSTPASDAIRLGIDGTTNPIESNILHHRERTDKGGSLVEMALMLPLLLLILAGIGDLGRAFHDYIVISNASREGARYASHFPNDLPGILNAVTDEAVGSGISVEPNLVSLSCTTDCRYAPSGSPIIVTVRFPFQTVLARIVGVNVLTLTAHTQMIVFGYD